MAHRDEGRPGGGHQSGTSHSHLTDCADGAIAETSWTRCSDLRMRRFGGSSPFERVVPDLRKHPQRVTF
jgi:hypothetical protein